MASASPERLTLWLPTWLTTWPPILLSLFSLLTLAACAQHPPASPSPVSGHPEQDRQAILAMAGDYEVRFEFIENLALAPGYSAHEPHISGGHERVLVLEDSPERIVLQHLLVSSRGHVVKHWRQDWEYQPARSWRYLGGYRWAQRNVAPEEAAGKWVQTVWQVDDSPRYAALGRWEHAHGISRWTSEETWRPLPRREHTTRDDYDVLIGTNRHTLTAAGWAHEQHNYKLDRASDRYLAHEVATNTYTRSNTTDLSAASAYWEKTNRFWAAVRAYWDELLYNNPSVALIQPSDTDSPSHLMAMLEQANDLSHQQLDNDALAELVRDTLAPYLADAP